MAYRSGPVIWFNKSTGIILIDIWINIKHIITIRSEIISNFEYAKY